MHMRKQCCRKTCHTNHVVSTVLSQKLTQGPAHNVAWGHIVQVDALHCNSGMATCCAGRCIALQQNSQRLPRDQQALLQADMFC